MNPMILMLNLKATNVILLYKYSEKGRIGVFGMFQGLIGFGACQIIVTEEDMPFHACQIFQVIGIKQVLVI